MTKDEALRLAWNALEDIGGEWGFTSQRTIPKRKEAITAIKEALAQPEQDLWAGATIDERWYITRKPEQEPVAWIYKGEKSFDGNKYSDEYELTASKQVALWKDKDAKPLYTTPPQRKPLSDEEIQDLLMPVRISGDGYYLRIARAIETAHGIKENT
jgi:hypothetical protein